MSFSYDPALPAWLDHARLALADLDAENPLLDDETIDALLCEFGYLEGLAQLADSLAVRAAQDPSRYGEGSAGLIAEWSNRVAAWRQLAENCRAGRVSPPAGGLARSGVAQGQMTAPDGRGYRSD